MWYHRDASVLHGLTYNWESKRPEKPIVFIVFWLRLWVNSSLKVQFFEFICFIFCETNSYPKLIFVTVKLVVSLTQNIEIGASVAND